MAVDLDVTLQEINQIEAHRAQDRLLSGVAVDLDIALQEINQMEHKMGSYLEWQLSIALQEINWRWSVSDQPSWARCERDTHVTHASTLLPR